ncbi:hypothetical protein Z517_06837 [Fonsecaea pedrosoi CBS 271.37]|uniref:NAD(P)-binding protein n=1 Tax=Fonsecaea pedrosoi CBS 271.37 TaxID=1442368 RepID=A0A0D2F0P4_9EURO|nr:uncharacterized protein Z517_06837 [Fonsecaea pedrosoi CBS 271.37]KIW80222.1 hypothetical protein Z517_06837 [Fonsecaea pedrosoi CBS 271.37]
MAKGVIPRGIAFVTGGARGLGNAVAVSFAREGAAGVVLVDIMDEEGFKAGKEAVEKYGTECLVIKADVTKEDHVRNAIAEAVRKFGRIDYAANFAGIGGAIGMTWDVAVEDWRKVIEVNQIGVWLCTKYQLEQMKKQEPLQMPDARPQRGSVVNCASVNSIQTVAMSSAYTASKHAVVGFTKTAALEARQYDIRVNAISPGFLRTNLVLGAIQSLDGSINTAWEQLEARQGRAGGFNEIGDAAVFLSSPKLSLVNAHNLVVDGGFTINYGSS